MAEKSLDVVVIGGSLTGLMHGIVLQRRGHNVRILERSPSSNLEGQGAGIVARDNVQTFLRKHDLSQRPYAVQSPNVQYLKKDATLQKTWNIALPVTSWNVLYYRLRANFDGLQSDYCPQRLEKEGHGAGKAVYSHGCTVTHVKYVDKLVTVEFDNVKGGGGSLHADLVIAADGPRSQIREKLEPDLKRDYAGYVAWRGTVPESEMSEKTRTILGEKITYFRGKHTHILLYTIPGPNGTLNPGSRLLNWVWYRNYAASSPDLANLMTDSSGHRHRFTLPIGSVQASVRTQLIADASAILPFPFAELVSKTANPFVQTVTGIVSHRALFFDGKLILAGDALATFRPHVVASTNQAALHAFSLEKVMRGEMTMKGWERGCLDYARKTALMSVALGSWNQSRYWGLFVALGGLVRVLVLQWVMGLWYRYFK